jgi:hypothetical protein
MQISYDRSILKKSVKVIPFLLLGLIIYDLSTNEKLFFSFDFLRELHWNTNHFVLILTVVCLMFVNWLVEARKWQLLTNTYFQLSIKDAFTSVLSGISTAFFTPNRIGDFIGRVSHLPKEHRKNGMISSFFGSYSQWLLTIIMGWVAWIQLGHQLIESPIIYNTISFLYFLAILGLLFLFLSKRIKPGIFNRFSKYFVHPPSFANRLQLIGLSMFRYFIFTTQFFLLLKLFGIDLSYGLVLSKLGLFYLITSLIPSTFWAELGIKESLAVWVFSGLLVNSLIIATATLLLWVINLLIPAIAGNYFLYKKTRSIS